MVRHKKAGFCRRARLRRLGHLLLQTRTRTLDGTLRDLLTAWYPAMPANDVQLAPFAVAA